jgi:transcriptional regulator with XRE-family HTH domain
MAQDKATTTDIREPTVGQQIRSLRQGQGLSLRALAERCGLSANAISLIERGENSPTVSSLHLLAQALNVSITDFFETQHEEAVVFVQPETRLRSTANGIIMESLGIGLRNQQLEPFLITLAPLSGNLDQPVTHAGEEFVYCLEGTLEYAIKDRVYRLVPGAALLFDAQLDHCFCNVGTEPAVVLMIFYAGEGAHLARRLHMMAPGEE